MDSRVHKAQRLFTRMNSLLGSDYDKKMSVVGILKQFAEDHEVEKLAYTLDLLLQHPMERKLIHDIRPFVHYRQLEVFDAILDNDVSRRSNRSLERRRPRTPDLTRGERRAVQIKRNQGAFGFILRGHNPVYIEKVDPGSAADRAGLKRGDCLLKLNGLNVERASHNHLVKLLQGSGQTPTFEVITMVDHQGEPIRPESVASTVSSESSEEDCAWMNEAVIDREGRSFKQRADHLLTKREREFLRQAMQAYNEDRNIRDFYDVVSGVFDTPSKTTLWMYIIPKLANNHKDYCMRRIDVPHELLLDVYPRDQLELIMRAKSQRSDHSPDISYESLADADVAEISEIASFKQQLEYILTPRERLYLKNALQIYRDKRNIYNLVEDVGSIFDTPSKRTIWFYLIPLLADEDQEVCRRLLTNPNSAPPSPSQPVRHSSPNISQNYIFDEDSPDFINPDVLNDFNARTDDDVMTPATPKYGDVMFHNDDFKYVEIAAEMLRNDSHAPRQHHPLYDRHYHANGNRFGNEDDDVDGEDSDADSDFSQEEDRRVWRAGTSVQTVPQIHVNESFDKSFDRVSSLSSNKAMSPAPDYSPSDSNSLPDSISSIDQLELPPYPRAANSTTRSIKSEIVLFQDDRKSILGDRKSSVSSFRMLKEMDLNDPDMDLLPKEILESDAKIVIMQEVPDTPRKKSVGDKSVKSMDSFAEKARDAIQALDDALSGEDLDDEPVRDIPQAPKPPPIPLNVPQAPPPPVVKSHFREQHNQMYVKRLNWEKLELPNSKNTVWAQINHPSDLDDVVKYLELEHKFSTKRTEISTSFRERRNQITILHPKKSYNISILLGHLRLSPAQLRDALYSMNEEIFTPELLKQMLSYSPDNDEKLRYEQYNGLTSDLGAADQFGMEMVKIPGYRDRLKGMLFKANFAEKMEEVTLTMTYTRKASAELINSKKLAKVLELVLAMGNHLNRGNRRIGEASAFKIYGLSNLDTTKTSDGKSTFLHVLANAVAEKFPDVLNVKEELANVPFAAKASHETINDELVDLRSVLQDIQSTMNHIAAAPARANQVDRFHEVMEHFVGEASDHIQHLYSLQIQTEQDFKRMLEYFGENPDPKANPNRYEIFKIFTDFLYKFEKAHLSNMMVRH